MMKARTRRLLVMLLSTFFIVGLLPSEARAQSHPETSCVGEGTGSAGCYFQCIKNEKINISVINTTNSVKVTGTVRCGSQEKDAATTSGKTPPHNFDSGEVVMKKNYIPDDSNETANCFTDNAPGADISVACAPVDAEEDAAGMAAAQGDITFTPPLSLAGPGTSFVLSATAVGTVVDATTLQAFAGAFTVSGFGVSDTSLVAETCIFGEGDLSLSISGSGISASGTGRYVRVGDALRMLVAFDNLAINGVTSQSTTLLLTGGLASEQLCVAAPRSFASFAGAAVIGD